MSFPAATPDEVLRLTESFVLLSIPHGLATKVRSRSSLAIEGEHLTLELLDPGLEARDVKLRLSERSGEVHISLHSTDQALSGRLHEGVRDLVGSLASAGYDAEAWTAGQGRQNSQRQPEGERKPRRDSAASESPDDFSGMLYQPIQEVS